ncbi:protein of unknown function DUF397 [Salinispora tropica CNB-440]|uniref:DUF397 domain-containing protein n=2 Tax=Salinispora tropica TaxID=168695 RepID=A4X985_SALTO|nr:protein of unknown function DUF397 [Salinispora tropica CNB-440]
MLYQSAHVDSQAPAQILRQPADVATLSRRWERIRGEALPRAFLLGADQGSAGIMDLTGARWRKSGNNGGSCVEVADNLPGVVGVRDSKDPTGPALVFGPAAWRAFVTQLTDGS